MIKYLIKFVSQKSHADMLVAGELFMRPASYYHNLELGQGDIREAFFAYQKEYRIVVGKAVYRGINTDNADSVIYHLSEDMKEICRIEKTSDHLTPEGDYVFPVTI